MNENAPNEEGEPPCTPEDFWKSVSESKAAYRKRLAGLPIAEKLRLVEQMAERSKAIKASKKGHLSPPHNPKD